MVELLMEQPFDQITTVKISTKAGISRSSFYTHYKDKYDMIEHYQVNYFIPSNISFKNMLTTNEMLF